MLRKVCLAMLLAVCLLLSVHLLLATAAPAAAMPRAREAVSRVYLPFLSKPFEPCPPKDGLWAGQTTTTGHPEQPRSITFTVTHGGTQIKSGAKIGFYYRVTSGMFICSGGSMSLGWSVPIGADCHFHTSGGLLHTATWDGSFSSAHSGAGTYSVRVFTTMCGYVTRSGTWEATWRGPAP